MKKKLAAKDRTITATDVRFMSSGQELVGTHYVPASTPLDNERGAPAVVMAHGLSMTRDSGLSRYAERFAAAGIHVLTFDYRGFGDSGGAEREVVSVRRQVEDYHAALRHIRSVPAVDPERVALWGTSYSGGIAFQCAYEDRRHRSIVLQVPNLDNAATGRFIAAQLARKAPVRGLWLAARATRDRAAALLRLPPVYTPAMGGSGAWAAYVNDESMGHIGQFRGPNWKNRIALRDFVGLPLFRPVKHARKVSGPIMLITAERDDLTPVGPMLQLARQAGDRVELHRYDVSHFEVYTGKLYEELVEKEVEFLQRTLA